MGNVTLVYHNPRRCVYELAALNLFCIAGTALLLPANRAQVVVHLKDIECKTKTLVGIPNSFASGRDFQIILSTRRCLQ